MKKKIRLLVLMFLFMVAFITMLTTVSIILDAETQQGHWLYDREGNKVGCKSPGKDCYFY
jgi:hypothetical protein